MTDGPLHAGVHVRCTKEDTLVLIHGYSRRLLRGVRGPS